MSTLKGLLPNVRQILSEEVGKDHATENIKGSFNWCTLSITDVLKWHFTGSTKRTCMVYKSLNGLAPGYLRSRFVERSAITDYSLRNNEDKLAVPLPWTNFLKNSFRYSSGAVLWNSLPTHVGQARTLESFHAGCSGFFCWASLFNSHGSHVKQFT